MSSNEQPPEKRKILPFVPSEPRNGTREIPPVHSQLPESGATDPVDIRDEKYRRAHRELRKKFDNAEKASAAVDAMTGKASTKGIESAMRAMMIDEVTRTTGHPREDVARNLDTQLLTERAQADMEEGAYVALREMPEEEAESTLERAYTAAKEKYGHLYPAAAPTMFDHFRSPEAKPGAAKPEVAKKETSLIQKIRDQLKKLF